MVSESVGIMKPRIAVLLAAFNGSSWILDQINSIIAQEAVDLQIFISVDLSSDETYKMVMELSKVNSRISVLPYGATFGGAAKNFYRLTRDVDVNDFDYVAFSDQDDIWFSSKLCNACKRIESGAWDVYSSNVIAFWSDGSKKLLQKSYGQRKYDHFYESAGPGCTYVFSKPAFQAVQGFVEANFIECSQIELHDWLFYAYLRHFGFKWFIDPNPTMLYRQHGNNQFGANKGFGAYVRRFKMINGGWYKSQVGQITALIAPELAENLTSKMFVVKNFLHLRRRQLDRFILLLLASTGFY